MLVFLKTPFLVLNVSYYILMTLPDDIICNIANYVDDSTLYTNYIQASDLWQQLQLVCELNQI